jgi:catechol 2,3-dioxygenase-like lactoylglutathione lyase family enzyme
MSTPDGPWPSHLPVSQVRIARPTDRLDEVVAFYRDGLGLIEIWSFRGHAGYDGVMLGLPGVGYHLEFTRHERGSPGEAPSKDNLLVLYLAEPGAVETVAARLESRGHRIVEPENPYWKENSITFEDPDGWRVVLVRGVGFTD